MLTLEALTQFFGWCLVISVGIYLLIVLGVAFLGEVSYKISARIFDISHGEVKRETFSYVANFKLAITVLFLIPYIALKVMS